MKNYDKLQRLTSLSSLSISLVVLAHAFIFLTDNITVPGIFKYLLDLIVSFVMPLFMSISGFLFIHTNINRQAIDFNNFIFKKFKRLILPYLAIGSIAYIFKLALSPYALRPAELSPIFYLRSILYPYQNFIINYWFLPTLFIIFVFFASIGKNLSIFKNKRFNIYFTVILLLLNLFPFLKISLFNLKGSIHYLIYFWMGCLLCLYKDKTGFIERKEFFIICTSFLLLLNYLTINNAYLGLGKALLGIFSAYSLMNIYSLNKFKIINFMEGYSYQIFLLSWFFESPVRILFHQVMGLNPYLVSILHFAAGLILPVLATKLICRYLPFFRIVISVSPHMK